MLGQEGGPAGARARRPGGDSSYGGRPLAPTLLGGWGTAWQAAQAEQAAVAHERVFFLPEGGLLQVREGVALLQLRSQASGGLAGLIQSH